MDEMHFTFLIEEYKVLRQELDSRLKEVRLLETGAIVAISAIYAWLAKIPKNQIDSFAWWIPVLFPLFGLFRYFGVMHRIMHIAEYIRSFESQVCKNAPNGWETFLAEKRKTIAGI